MTGRYTIRPVDGLDEDVQELLGELHIASFMDTSPVPSFEEGAWWVAYDDGAPVGFAGITPSTYIANTGYLKRAGVLRAHRGKGLQRRLIRVRERYAKKQGWSTIYTDTAAFNVKSANNLFRAGFHLFRPLPPWNGESFLYWRKRYA
jgi:GNAT superfamily N-acetyltransferase